MDVWNIKYLFLVRECLNVIINQIDLLQSERIEIKGSISTISDVYAYCLKIQE